MRTFLILCAALGISVVLVAQTSPQSTPTQSPALTGNATNGVTEIRSERNQIFMRSKVYVWSGNVRVDNPKMKLRCELLTVESPKVSEGKNNRATAETNVVIDWWDDKGANHATADKAVYTYIMTNLATLPEVRWQTNNFVVLSGNPVVTNIDGVYRADPLVWDRVNDVITSTNFLDMKINQGQTNAPGLFDTGTPKANTHPK